MNTKALIRFVIFFSVIYGLVLLTSAAGDKIYGDCFRSFGKYSFASFGTNGIVAFESFKNSEQPKFSTKVHLTNKNILAEARRKKLLVQDITVTLSSWYTGYLPTMLTIALLLAIPGLAWKQKAWALVGGMVVIHLFIFVKLYIQVLYEFERNEWLQVVQFSPFKQKIMDNLHYLFVTSMGLNFILPVLICIATLLFFKNQLVVKVEK